MLKHRFNKKIYIRVSSANLSVQSTLVWICGGGMVAAGGQSKGCAVLLSEITPAADCKSIHVRDIKPEDEHISLVCIDDNMRICHLIVIRSRLRPLELHNFFIY